MCDRQVTIETRYGPLVVPNEHDTISRFLARCGEWAWDEVGFVASTLPDNVRVLDIGAFLGTFGLGLALRKCVSFICLVEANSAILPLLRTNILRNSTFPAVVVDAMVTGLPMIPRAGCGDRCNLGSTSFASDATDGRPTKRPSRAVTLADLRAEYGEFDLVKLDVEGMEHEILCNDSDHLARGNTTLWVECNEHPQSLELAKLILSWGLEMHYFAFPSHNPNNFHGEIEPIYPWAYEAGLLVAPMSPPRLAADLTAHHCILRSIKGVEDLEEAMWRTPRWLPTEFAHADAAELAAAASRALRGQVRGVFLSGAETAATAPADKIIRPRLTVAEAELPKAEALLCEQQDQLQQERERREAADQRLAEVTALALTRLAEIGAAREQAERATKQIEATQVQADERVRAVEAQADERVSAVQAQADEWVRTVEAQSHERVRAAEGQADERVCAAEEQARAAQQDVENVQTRLAAIEATIAWRLVTPVYTFVGSRPRLHTALRRVGAFARRMLDRRSRAPAVHGGQGD